MRLRSCPHDQNLVAAVEMDFLELAVGGGNDDGDAVVAKALLDSPFGACYNLVIANDGDLVVVNGDPIVASLELRAADGGRQAEGNHFCERFRKGRSGKCTGREQ